MNNKNRAHDFPFASSPAGDPFCEQVSTGGIAVEINKDGRVSAREKVSEYHCCEVDRLVGRRVGLGINFVNTQMNVRFKVRVIPELFTIIE